MMDIDGILTRKRNDSLEQIFVLNHKIEADSCDRFYQEEQITAIQKCRDCYTALFEKYRCGHGEGSMLRELNHELQKLANESAKLMAQADQAYSQENWDKALNYYQEALKIDNTSQYSLNQIKKIKQLT